MAARTWSVHKLGGTSLGNASCYNRVPEVIGITLPSNNAGSVSNITSSAVVVSAMAGITDSLLRSTVLARQRDNKYHEELQTIKNNMSTLVLEALEVSDSPVLKVVLSDIENIADLLKAIFLTKYCAIEMEELIVGHGELWSAQLLDAILRKRGFNAAWLDARSVLFVSRGETGPVVDWERSKAEADKWLASLPSTVDVVAVTGFIASTQDGLATTLRRNGSDYSASIFAVLLGAANLTIWKDVDGVYSADPRKVHDVVLLKELSFSEAMELAYFGAKILHPHAMAPAMQHNIPIHIRNVFHPNREGSIIKGHIKDDRKLPQVVRGFSTIPGISLINVEGTGMMGVPGIANRLFGSLKEVGVSVVLISQASSEHSICFAIPKEQGKLAQLTVQKAFFLEINHHKQIQRVDLVENCCVLAAVGDQMANTPGLSAKFFSALGNRDVNVLAIAQGSSERNISAVIHESQATQALQSVHSTFFRPYDPMMLSVGVIGPGLVGSTLLSQLLDVIKVPQDTSKFRYVVRGICNSRKMLFGSEEGVDLKSWKESLENSTHTADLDTFVRTIQKGYPRHAIIVDCTSSEQVARQYPKWLEWGVNIVAPNKRAFSGPLELYHNIKKAMQLNERHCLYETTVGAGLPIIHMIQELRATGDQVTKIEGIFSGTLSFIFNSFSVAGSKGDTKFSSIVLDAKQRGYTEPDPRDDLSGMDFARKVLILAREAGLELQLSDLTVQSLVASDDKRVAESPVEEFLSTHLFSLDKKWDDARASAEKANKVLRFVGVIDLSENFDSSKGPRATVGIKEYDPDHPFASLKGCDNVIAIYTKRYSGQPMLVQGPGAGAEVTAGGVFGDLFRIACYMS